MNGIAIYGYPCHPWSWNLPLEGETSDVMDGRPISMDGGIHQIQQLTVQPPALGSNIQLRWSRPQVLKAGFDGLVRLAQGIKLA